MKNMALFQKSSKYNYFLFIFYYQYAKFGKNRREKFFWAQRSGLGPNPKKLRPKEIISVFIKKSVLFLVVPPVFGAMPIFGGFGAIGVFGP